MVEGKDVVKEDDNVISSLLSSSLFFPTKRSFHSDDKAL
jgi:hypothetical protein